MAELHLSLHSDEPTTRWSADDDVDFDTEAMEQAMLARRRELFAALADLDAA